MASSVLPQENETAPDSKPNLQQQLAIPKLNLPPPRVETKVNKPSADWNVYRTRFLVRAKQLTEPLSFIDALGREHSGAVGDYLVEWSDGSRRVAPRQIFEDVYVRMESTETVWPRPDRDLSVPPRRRMSARNQATA